ncbi:hypothetical protein TrVE_jg9175 [Triparma verrucosa]|uniref:Uncharacterized protein n=1 Tax=Triparma verrucosa TaxID=1606542 RepID=A0A9W7BX12_9STRA|nr:hypothetical protein TrVE_jg9175 [Triparma verrucosa]
MSAVPPTPPSADQQRAQCRALLESPPGRACLAKFVEANPDSPFIEMIREETENALRRRAWIEGEQVLALAGVDVSKREAEPWRDHSPANSLE